jgi:hypothetical protein
MWNDRERVVFYRRPFFISPARRFTGKKVVFTGMILSLTHFNYAAVAWLPIFVSIPKTIIV